MCCPSPGPLSRLLATFSHLAVPNHNQDRSATCDFLLTFYSNHGPISYRFRDRRRFHSKIAKFPTPCISRPLELGIGAGGQKTRTMELPGRQKSLTISSAVWIECTNVTDRWTDTGPQQRPRLRLASRGKKNLASTIPKDSFEWTWRNLWKQAV